MKNKKTSIVRIRIINTFLMKRLCLMLKIGFVQMISENNGLEFDQFKAAFD